MVVETVADLEGEEKEEEMEEVMGVGRVVVMVVVD